MQNDLAHVLVSPRLLQASRCCCSGQAGGEYRTVTALACSALGFQDWATTDLHEPRTEDVLRPGASTMYVNVCYFGC
jgi:hypothetical protein